MAMERGLGRGLDSLLRSTRDMETPAKETNKLALTQLVPGQHQPRKNFDETALAELATSIKNQGVVQPLIVRAKPDTTPQLYEIVAGERRWRAAKMAGLTDVPVVITSYSDDEAMTIALIENLQREDLNPVEEALAFASLKDAYSLSQEDLAAKLGKSRSAVANSLRLLQLPEPILESLGRTEISAGHARTLLAIDDENTKLALHAAIVAQGLSVREVEAAVEAWKRTGMLPASLTGNSAPKENKARPAKPQEVKHLQKQLRAVGHRGAIIGGDGEKGKVSLPYSSHAELLALLTSLGLSPEDAPLVTSQALSLQDEPQAVSSDVELELKGSDSPIVPEEIIAVEETIEPEEVFESEENIAVEEAIDPEEQPEEQSDEHPEDAALSEFAAPTDFEEADPVNDAEELSDAEPVETEDDHPTEGEDLLDSVPAESIDDVSEDAPVDFTDDDLSQVDLPGLDSLDFGDEDIDEEDVDSPLEIMSDFAPKMVLTEEDAEFIPAEPLSETPSEAGDQATEEDSEAAETPAEE